MILLDKPLVSDFLRKTIKDGHILAHDTGNVLIPTEAVLLGKAEALKKYQETPGMNMHTTSENALKWIYENLSHSELPGKISLFKNKIAFRDLMKDLYPGLYYRKVNVSSLDGLDIGQLPSPFIIKPAVGFFSMSVHKVFGQESWEKVKDKIMTELEAIRSIYPEEVLKLDDYIVEACIEGDEYAIDAYFDDEGRPVLMGVMQHPFSGEGDVSDRLYNTSREIVQRNNNAFNSFLVALGDRAGLKNFSLHVEVRINDKGQVVPIEVNPLRFGAWCTSADLAHYAFGFNPYSTYINKQRPDWDRILGNSNGDIYSIIILENSTGVRGSDIIGFDYDRVVEDLGRTEILEIRKINYREYPIFGILFTRTAPEDYGNIERILGADMRDYLIM